jgi:SET domain-containing protein
MERVSRPPQRLGMGTICARNKARNVECTAPCNDNAPLTNNAPTCFLLKYHPDKQWCLYATQSYRAGDPVGEYVGAVLSWAAGERRWRAKSATDPSYIHELQQGNLYLDAERTGNAMRFLNHTCVNPTCRYEVAWTAGMPRMQVVADRRIKVGEELTASYGFLSYHDSNCQCGCYSCQGFMGKTVRYTLGPTVRKIPHKPLVVGAEVANEARRWGQPC